MAHFYASANGSAQTSATRQGTKDSGIESHTRGWNLGVRVDGRRINGEDSFLVKLTGGSNRKWKEAKVAVASIDDDGRTFVTLYHPVTGNQIGAPIEMPEGDWR